MAGLAEIAAKLGRLKRQLAAHAETPADEGRMKEVTGFGANPGALRMLTYAPEGLPPGAPLVVVLHGCGQRAEAHASTAGWLTLAEQYGFAVLAPEQAPTNNPNRCFNWFEPEDTARGEGEAASIHAMVGRCIAQHKLDRRRVFVTGLSAGGAMAAVMLAAYPETFSAGAVIAGLPYGAARNLREALTLMHSPQELGDGQLGALIHGAAPAGGRLPRVSVWHGDLDQTVNHRNGAHSARQWAAAHGLAPEPDEVEVLPRRIRSVWRTPDGETVIESNLVPGLGHGTPLASTGEDGLGSPAPFMIEAGVSSSLEVARFWGLAPAAAEEPVATPHDAPAQARHPALAAWTVPAGFAAPTPHQAPFDVQAAITRALKNAGLM
jgi:poly(hydroxyalkanoate) depolymerase family esterase